MEEQTTPRLTLASDAPARDDEDARIVYAIVIIGAIVAVPPLAGLLGVLTLDLGGGSSHASGLGILFALGYAALGIGLMLRREVAREIFCVLAVISLILLGVGVLSEAAAGGSSARTAAGRQADVLRTEIAATEADTRIAAPARQRLIAPWQVRLHQLEAQAAESAAPEPGYGRFVPGLILALLPLVFFTNLRVKREFE